MIIVHKSNIFEDDKMPVAANDNFEDYALLETDAGGEADETLDHREFGLCIEQTERDAEDYGLERSDELRELDFSEERYGARGYLSED